MHRLVPRSILGAKWWAETRQKAFESTDNHCVACGIHKSCAQFHKWLEGHEVYTTDYVQGRLVYVETVPLCHACHNYIHSGRLKALLDQGKISHQRYAAIIQHGDRILERAGLRKPLPYDGRCAEWSRWRLVLNGKHYPPLFKSIEEWMLAHASSQED